MGGMEKLSLDALARELIKAATAAPAGRASRTVYGGHEHVLRQTLISLTAGASMSEHEDPGEATVHCYRVGYALLLTPSSGKGATATC
jgi:quercetin dioxygenase-like cupin family protein